MSLANSELTYGPSRAGNAHDRDSWESIQAIKSQILRIWEGAPPPVRICCIKFAQRVVLAQTASNGMDSKVRLLLVAAILRASAKCDYLAIRTRRVAVDHTTESPLTRPASARGRGYGPPRPDARDLAGQQQVSVGCFLALDSNLLTVAHYSEALLVDATLNTLSVLVRTRPSTSARILNTILNFNPLKLANSPMTPKTKVLVKSMEKTTRMLLIHLSKR